MGVQLTERRDLEVGKPLGCLGCVTFATETNRSISHNSEYWKRVERAVRDDAAGAERLEESLRRKGVKWRQDRTGSWARAAAASAVEQLRSAAKCTRLEELKERPTMQGWSLNELAGWATLRERQAMVVIGILPQLSK